MADKKVKIDIVAQDKTKNAVNATKKGLDGLKKSVFNLRNAFLGLGTGLLIKNLVQTGKEVESLKVRFKFLFGSAQEGALAFDNLAKFASKVPFSLEDIASASGNLAVVSKNANDLSRILEITGNVAAVTGLDFQTTASQIQRAFSGGIAAADIFREKGVRSLLGFQQGAKVSIEDTIKAFEDVFSGNGRFATATDALAETFEGTVSMLGDKLFTFKNQINETFFASLKQAMGSLNKFFEDNARSTEKLAIMIGKTLSVAVIGLAKTFKSLKDNADTVLTVFASIISLKIASVFVGIATAINGMTVAMTSFNMATKRNIIFGAITVFTGSVVFLTSKFKALKNAIADLEPATGSEALIKVQEKRLELEKAQAKLEADRGLTRENLSKKAVTQLESELKVLEEQLKVFSRISFEKNRPTMRDVAGSGPKPREEIKASRDLSGIIQANKTELELLTEKNNKEFELVQEQLIKLGQIKRDAQLGKTRELSEEELVLFNQLHETKVALELNFQEKITAIQKAEAQKRERFNQQNLNKFKSGKFQEINIADMTEKEKGQFVKDSARATLQEAAKMNKKMFRLNQALNIGEAIMNTAAGVSKALAQGGAFGIPMAIAIGAMGAIQVATIAAQQPPAMFGGSRQQGTPFLVGERGPELFTPATAGTVTPNHQLPSGGHTVNFNITTVDAQSFGALLDTRRGQIVNMINTALNNKGQAALVWVVHFQQHRLQTL